MFIYFILANANSLQWNRFDFANQGVMVLLLCYMLLKSQRDKGVRIAVQIFMGIALFKVLFNLYGFIDMNIFETANNSHWSGGAIGGCILVFLIYKRYGMVKR
jgi:membrane associated rhomboid family serine protease